MLDSYWACSVSNDTDTFDILIIGGGINGAGIARDAAGRNLSVALCEMEDFASATSSASSKLIHGGLRYLEHYEFSLVRKALREREVLLASAPHIIWPLRFVLPHHKKLRPTWLLRVGLFLYDHMGGRKLLPATKKLALSSDHRGVPLKSRFKVGFEYSDCWVDDARMTLLNVRDAADKGASIFKGWKCSSAQRMNGLWQATLMGSSGEIQTIKAKALVNAAGAWAASITNMAETDIKKRRELRLVKGSHIVVPKLYDGDHAYTFQEADGRVIFAIPYEVEFTLIGTTDVSYDQDASRVSASDDEIIYLCNVANDYFNKSITPDDVKWHYSGIRPLVDDGETDVSQVTRDYQLVASEKTESAPLLSVYGGKITTYRKLAEDALSKLAPWFPAAGPKWTEQATLPGGDMGGLSSKEWSTHLQAKYPWVKQDMLLRYARQYGSMSEEILAEYESVAEMGQYFGGTLYEAELRYLMRKEWAATAEDVLWRRTKLGLHLTNAEKTAVAEWMSTHSKISYEGQ